MEVHITPRPPQQYGFICREGNLPDIPLSMGGGGPALLDREGDC